MAKCDWCGKKINPKTAIDQPELNCRYSRRSIRKHHYYHKKCWLVFLRTIRAPEEDIAELAGKP